MFERKLLALDYPAPDQFNINNTKEFRSVILWLEDQKIRHYKVEDRGRLRDLDSSNWDAAYKAYLNDIACPIKSKKPEEELEWLLAFAVRLEYGDRAEKYKEETSENVLLNQVNAPKVVSANSLDNLNFQSPEFVAGVNKLAEILKVTPHPDHLITLKAISKVITTRLSPQCLENPNSVIIKGHTFLLLSFLVFRSLFKTTHPVEKTRKSALIVSEVDCWKMCSYLVHPVKGKWLRKGAFPFLKGTPFPFQEADLGFDMGDYVLNEAAKILRLLYIHNLRNLQTQINEAIVSVQTVTANPKTDTKLGQVGR